MLRASRYRISLTRILLTRGLSQTPANAGQNLQFPGRFLPYRDDVYGVVYDRGDRAVHCVSVEAGVLARLQEHRRRRGRPAVLRDALQRSIDDELRGSQVERVAAASLAVL